MSAWFLPTFEGELDTPEGAEEALARITRAVEAGTLLPFTGARGRYVIVQTGVNRLRFRAATFLAAVTIGLNEVFIETHGGHALRYTVTFYRWCWYIFALVGNIMAFHLTALLLIPALRETAEKVGLDKVLLAYCGPAAFFLLLFPFVMAAMHRPMARRVLETRLRAAVAGEDPSAIPLPGARGGIDYRSDTIVMGLPLVHVAVGGKYGGNRGVARGIIAIGDIAMGVVAVGGAAVGVVAIGGAAVGVVALGGCAVGLAVAVGGFALGTVAAGGLAIGVVAAGGLGIGLITFAPGP